MPPGIGYRDMLSRLHSLVGQDSAARKATISDTAATQLSERMPSDAEARGFGQDYEGRRYREPPAPDAEELGIRRQTMQMSQADGDSTDELRNYALLQRQRRLGGAPQAVDMAAARQQHDRSAAEAAGVVNGPQGSIPAAVDPAKAAQLAELEQAKQDAIAAMNAPPVDPAKAAMLAELQSAGDRTAAEIGAIGSKAPGTARGVAGALEQRRREILARLATPAATGGANAPGLSQPGPMVAPAFPQPAYPQVASAPPLPPTVPAPVAQFPLITPPVYPPSPGYPTPAPPRTADLDQAAAAQYARTRLGLGGP